MTTTHIATSYQIITDRILALLEHGTIPWQQPWQHHVGVPRNLFSQRLYNGINVWLLSAMCYPSPFWATFHQVTAAGGSVRKGEHGVPVVFWKVYETEDSDTGDHDKRFVLRYYTVFNLEQCEGINSPESVPVINPIEQCENIVRRMPNPPGFEQDSRARYRPSTDTVGMPARSAFTSTEAYYSTLFHKLTHNAEPRVMPQLQHISRHLHHERTGHSA